MDKTEIENDKTQMENTTEIEDLTEIENTIASTDSNQDQAQYRIEFKDFKTIRQFPTSGAEADIYLLEKDNEQFVLKLYRFNMKPSRDILSKLKELGRKYPEDIIKIYDIGFDETLHRWYELQEHARFGSLKDLMQEKHDVLENNMQEVIREMALLLKTLHFENIIHRDIKPDNLLVRTIDPLDLIITDFGISSVLDEELSKKMTTKSGTRIYFAPESFSGVVGKEVDYWAMGMILLEILIGDNIFRGINEGMVAHEIFTKGVKIPSSLDSHMQLLLKGLLTRDPKTRWTHEEVFQWLEGKVNIKIGYSYDEEEHSNMQPYTFEQEKFYDMKNLLIKMYKPEYIDQAMEHIMRGYMNQWLEKNELLDDAIMLDKLKKGSNHDLILHNIFSHYVQPDKFMFLGKLINKNNVTKFLVHCIDNNASGIEKRICDALENGVLLIAAKNFFKTNNGDQEALLDMLNQVTKTKSYMDTYCLIKAENENHIAYNLLQSDIIIEAGIVAAIYNLFNKEKLVFPQKFIDDLEQDSLIVEKVFPSPPIEEGSSVAPAPKYEVEVSSQIVVRSKGHEPYLMYYLESSYLLQDLFMTEGELDFFLKHKNLMGFSSVDRDEILQNVDKYIEIAKIAKSINSDNIEEYSKIYKNINLDMGKIIMQNSYTYPRFKKKIDTNILSDFIFTTKQLTERELYTVRKFLISWKREEFRGILIFLIIWLLVFYIFSLMMPDGSSPYIVNFVLFGIGFIMWKSHIAVYNIRELKKLTRKSSILYKYINNMKGWD